MKLNRKLLVSLGNVVKLLRSNQGYGLVSFIEGICDLPLYENFEAGEGELSSDVLEKICKKLDIEYKYLYKVADEACQTFKKKYQIEFCYNISIGRYKEAKNIIDLHLKPEHSNFEKLFYKFAQAAFIYEKGDYQKASEICYEILQNSHSEGLYTFFEMAVANGYLIAKADTYYPKTFEDNEYIKILKNQVESINTLFPYDYFCCGRFLVEAAECAHWAKESALSTKLLKQAKEKIEKYHLGELESQYFFHLLNYHYDRKEQEDLQEALNNIYRYATSEQLSFMQKKIDYRFNIIKNKKNG